MTVDVKKLFNEELTASLATKGDAARKIGGTYGINITGAGNWKIDLVANPPTIASSEAEVTDAQVVIGVAEADFQTLVADPGAGMKLFFAGKLKVKGNQMLAMKLKDLFALR